MKIRIEFEVDEYKLKTAICSAWEKAYNEPLEPAEIADFGDEYVMPETDIENMIAGSCLAEIIDVQNCKFKKVL